MLLLAAIFFLAAGGHTTVHGSEFHAIAYHGVKEGNHSLSSDDITVETLVNHFEWLHANGYTPVSVEQLIQAQKGAISLPDKAVLLCWDDGYSNFYTHVLPLLKAYNYPALLALVGSWMTTPMDEQVKYGSEYISRENFLSWKQIQEIAETNLVEIASHSFDLHEGLLADDYGDMLPATITHRYSQETRTYETDSEMKRRIAEDLKKNNALIKEKTGKSPRAVVWPFGRYNTLAVEVAKKLGMPITLTLDPVAANSDTLSTIPRIYPTLNPETGSFRYSFIEPSRPPLRRFFHIQAMDLVEDDKEAAFSTFLERIKNISPARVYLDPIVEDGDIPHSLFRNNTLPTITDKLIRLSWHTNRRAGAEVHLNLSDSVFQAVPKKDYTSFFSAMGRSAPCSGLLLSVQKPLPSLLQSIGKSPHRETATVWNPNIRRQHRQQLLLTTDSVTTRQILAAIEAFQYWQPFLDIGLLLPLTTIEQTETAVIQNLMLYFDYIMVDVGKVDAVSDMAGKLQQLIARKKIPPYSPIQLGFSSEDTTTMLTSQLRELQNIGIVDYGYRVDDFLNNSPEEQDITPLISARSYPYIPK